MVIDRKILGCFRDRFWSVLDSVILTNIQRHGKHYLVTRIPFLSDLTETRQAGEFQVSVTRFVAHPQISTRESSEANELEEHEYDSKACPKAIRSMAYTSNMSICVTTTSKDFCR